MIIQTDPVHNHDLKHGVGIQGGGTFGIASSKKTEFATFVAYVLINPYLETKETNLDLNKGLGRSR